jgi:hypothetical protein
MPVQRKAYFHFAKMHVYCSRITIQSGIACDRDEEVTVSFVRAPLYYLPVGEVIGIH